MPEKAKSSERKRRPTKDRVLQARIPEQLDEELRERAEKLGLSVSTIVRNVLLHTFDLVEGVVVDSTHIAKALAGWDDTAATQRRTDSATNSNDLANVLGWQEAVLNQNGVCAECNTILPTGTRAAIGVPASSHATLLCLDCLSALCPATPTKPVKRQSTRTAKKPRAPKAT